MTQGFFKFSRGKDIHHILSSMKCLALVFSLFFLSSGEILGQAVGDYRSTQDGSWTQLNRWQRLNALPNTWAQPTAVQGYPGQFASPTTVTILNGHDLIINVTPANTIGTLIVGQGTSGTLQTDANNRTLTINTLQVASGATFNLERLILTVNNTTIISGIINDDNNNGTNTFSGLVTINNGGSFSPTANSAITFGGGITNNGTFNKAGTGNTTFSNTQTLDGNNVLTFSGGDLIISNPATVTVATDISFSGTNFTNNSNAAVALNAIAGTFTFLPNAAQTINGSGTGTINFYNLTAAGGNTKTANLPFNVSNNLAINTGVTLTTAYTGSATYTIGGNATLNGTGTFNLGTAASTFNINGSMTMDGTLNFGTTAAKTVSLSGNLINTTGTITMTGAGLAHVLNLAGASNAITTFTTTAGSGSTVNYNGSIDQTVFSSTSYQNLTISGSNTKTLTGAITVNNNLNIQGTSTLAGDIYGITGTATGVFDMDANTTLTLGNTTDATAVTFPSNFVAANITLDNTSTVVYQAMGNQTVSSVEPYGNLTLATTGTKTIAGNITVNNNLHITGSAILASGTNQITGNVTGNLTMEAGSGLTLGTTSNATNVLFPTNFTSGNISLDPTSTVIYQSNGAQTVSGIPTYGNLTLSTIANGFSKTLNGGNIRVNGALTLNNNIFILNNNSLTLSANSSISGSAFSATNMIDLGSGSIIKEGNDNNDFILTFPIGIGTAYTPVQIADFSATTIDPGSTITLQSAASTAPGVPGTHPLNRYWTTSTSGISGSVLADISFTFVAGDIPAGGTASLYEIVYQPIAGTWGMPGGAGIAGSNPLRASTATTLDAIWTGTEPDKRIFYSMVSGSWDVPETWTLDPSGTQYLNPNNVTPTTSLTSTYDEVVILSGRTVTVPTNGKVNKKLTVTGTIDFGSTTGHSFNSILGNGRIMLSGDNFPTGDATHFITKGQGEGTVEYYGSNRDLNTPRTFFHVDVNMTGGDTLSLLTDYVINGDLTLTSGTFQINNASANVNRNITVYGNVLIQAAGILTTGTAQARHQLNLYGNFTNKGKAYFTDRTAADYANEATSGITDVNFLSNEQNQTVLCDGVTNFYRIEIDKGTDDTYILNLDATAVTNFKLFGYASENHNSAVAQLTENNNAFGLVRGTVRVGNSIEIPVLSSSDVYCISSGAQLWIDRGSVTKNLGQTIVTYGKLRISNGSLNALTNSGLTFGNQGILSIDGGTVNTNQIRTSDLGSANYGSYIQTAGTVNVVGGTTNTDYYVFSLPYSGCVFNMSGGTLKVNPSAGNGTILINSGDENIKISGGSVIAEANSAENIIITSTAPFWNLSFRNSTTVARQFSLGAASNIGPDNVAVSAQPLKVMNDFRIWGKESGGPTYPTNTFIPGTNDVYIGGSFYLEDTAAYVAVGGGSAPYDNIASQPTSRNTTWFYQTTGTGINEVFYHGDAVVPVELGNLTINRNHGYRVTMTSHEDREDETIILDVNGTASVISGTLNQNLYTIRTWGAIVNNDRMGTYVAASTPSGAQIRLVENPALTLTTTSDAVFGNIQINVTPPSVLSLTSDVYMERVEYVKGLIYLKNFNLKIDDLWKLEPGIFENHLTSSYLKVTNNGYSGSSMIYTDGRASDGGLSIRVSAATMNESPENRLNNYGPITFPIGFTPNSGTTLYFRPAQVAVQSCTSPGYITIRPVAGPLPTSNITGGEILQHYWRVTHSGYSTVPNVSFRFYYKNQIGVSNIDLPTGSVNESTYVPGQVLDGSPYTRSYDSGTDIYRLFGTGNSSRFLTINGTDNNNIFVPTSGGISLVNANYSAGVYTRFTGSVRIYYSIDNTTVDGGMGAPWNQAQSWAVSDNLNTALTSPHNSAQNRATTIPGPGDVVQIGWVPWDDPKTTVRGQPHCIWLTDSREVAEVVFLPMTDASGNPVPRYYRSNFQFRPTLTINGRDGYDFDGLTDNGVLTAKLVKGEGLFWNRETDPNYTIMDIGDFARDDSSYVIYENFTDGRIINNTPALFPNIYISNNGWGDNNHNFTFSKDIVTTGNVELLGDVNLLLPTGATGNIIAGRNLVMFQSGLSGGGARIDYQNNGTARKVIVKGDLLMKNSNSIIQVVNPNAGIVDHELHVEGNIIQASGNTDPDGLDLYSGVNNDRITLFLDGNNNMVYNRVNGTIPDLYRLVVNKGNSINTTAQFNTNFTLNGPTNGSTKALELQNGLFIVNNTTAGFNLTLTSGGDHFEIPSTAGLQMNSGNALASGTSGILLDGLLRLNGGNVNMAGGDNPIVYSSSGKATLHVINGTLTVGGQIRRSTTSDAGVLTYIQEGGVVIAGRSAASVSNRGVFEITNTGSSFNMTGGNLYIVRAQTSATIPALFFDPASAVIESDATIHLGNTNTPASQTIGAYINKPVPVLRLNNTSGNNPTAKLEIVPASIANLLQIDAGSVFNANGVDLYLQGNLTVNGTFTASGNTTYFNGTGTQIITGSGLATPINFYSVDKTNSNELRLTAGNTPLVVANEFLLRNGTLTDNANNITVRGHVHNDAVHVNNGGDGIIMNGTTLQTLTGNGTFGKLTINNPNRVEMPVGNSFLITRSLELQSGVLDIGQNLLDLGLNAVIEEASPFSSTNMIETNISFTDNGVRKTFPAGASPIFTFPIGSGGKYTPVRMIISANGNSTGSITVTPANEIHPSIVEDTETSTQIIDKDNALQYYWTLTSNGISNFSAEVRMRYDDGDIKVGPEYTIGDYHTACLLLNGSGNWLKFDQDDFDESQNDLVFNFTTNNDATITGDYTAGAGDASLNGAIPDQVSRYETVNNGDWTNGNIWTPVVSGGPRGAIAVINTPHTVDVFDNYRSGYMTEIYGILKLYSTFGHRLGIVRGTGTMYLERGDIPAAIYDEFFSSAGGTLEFGGTSTYDILGNITEVNNLKFSGSGLRRFPNNDLTLNGTMTIDGTSGLSVNNYYNRQITIKGNLIRNTGNFEAGTGSSATLVFNGPVSQEIRGSFSGTNALNNLQVNNPNDINIANDVEIERQLSLTNGLINMSPGALFRIKYGATVSPASGSAISFVNGVCTKEMINGNSFTFPIGNFSDTKAHGPVSLLTVNGPSGINDWMASYFYANATLAGYNTESFDPQISTVSHSEYWKIEGPTGGNATIRIFLDGSSDVASSVSDLADLRIAGWDPVTNGGQWVVVGSNSSITGNETSGTITTTETVNFGDYTYFTLASVVPIEASTATITSPENVSLCDGQSTTIRVTFTGEAPYILTYTDGTTSFTTDPPITDNFYEIDASPEVGVTTYTLLSITANDHPGTITGITSATITVNPIPSVIISRIPTGDVCEGLGITFTATAGYDQYRFRVDNNGLPQGSNNTYSVSTLTPGVHSVDVIVTDEGCSNTSSAASVNILPLPEDAGIITGSPSVCLNASAVFEVPAIDYATTYIWSATNGATGTSTTRTITYNFPNAGATRITVFGRNSCGDGNSRYYDVTVSTSSTPGAAGNITGPAEICKGDTGYAYSVNPVANATSYVWTYTGTGQTIDGTGNNITIDFSNTATAGILTVAGTNGCATGAVSNDFPITVNTPPSASISPSDPSTCSNASITLTGSALGGELPYASYLWSGEEDDSLTVTNATTTSFKHSVGGDYDLIFTTTDNNGCKGSDTVTVTVYQAPVANAGSDATNLCTGTDDLLMTGASASGSYTGNPVWSSTGGIWTQNPLPALAKFKPSTRSGSVVATLSLTGTNGCANTSDTKLITWSDDPLVPGAFIISSTPVCQGQDSVLYQVPEDVLATTYNWTYTLGTGATFSNSTDSVYVDFSSVATSGRINVTATNACGTSAARTLDITVRNTPNASVLSGDTAVCAGTTGQLYTVTNNASWVYLWTIEDNVGTIQAPGNTSSVTIDWKDNGDITELSTETSVVKQLSVTINFNPTTGCSKKLDWDMLIFRNPETGPAYVIPNTFAE